MYVHSELCNCVRTPPKRLVDFEFEYLRGTERVDSVDELPCSCRVWERYVKQRTHGTMLLRHTFNRPPHRASRSQVNQESSASRRRHPYYQEQKLIPLITRIRYLHQASGARALSPAEVTMFCPGVGPARAWQ